jgi:hypothetical protein
MPSTQAVLSATPTLVSLPAPTSRVVVSILANAATVVVTADGSYPSLPSAGVTNTQGAVVISGVAGELMGVVQPPLFGDHMAAPTLRLASTGTPTVLISW